MLPPRRRLASKGGLVLAGLLLAGCSVFGIRSGTPEPAYTVVARLTPGVEVRDYAPRLAAAVTVPGDEIAARSAGFRRLAAYIFGRNIAMTAPVAQASAKIAMTAPVVQAASGDGWTIMFFMPADYTLATLPKPVDPGISIVTVPGETAAVLRYSGFPGRTAGPTARLMAALHGSGWRAVGAPVAWFYDPPWTLPWARRNEIAVPVARP